MKGIFPVFALLTVVTADAQGIAAARSAGAGSTVTVTGIVTNGSELGSIRYMQDKGAGIAVFPGSGSAANFSAVKRGDSVTVSGPLKQFNNLLEIDPVKAYTIHASRPIPSPYLINNILEMGEAREGMLVTLPNASIISTGTFAGNTNYEVGSNGQSYEIRIGNSAVDIVGKNIPTGTHNITGVLSQYCTTAPPCGTGFQLLVRTMADFATSVGLLESSRSTSVVFPNPADGFVVIKSIEPVLWIEISDLFGKTTYSGMSDHVLVDGFPEGIYNVKVTTSGGSKSTRLVILH